MNNVLKVLGIVVLAVILIAAGVVLGVVVSNRLAPATAQQPAQQPSITIPRGGPRGGNDDGRFPNGNGMMGRGGGYRNWNGRGGMMGGSVPDASLVPPAGETLTLDQAVKVADAYLKDYGNSNLEVAEVMQFSNNFYAAIKEKDTGIGAFEILIDPKTAVVSPEPGPNMMWNTKYGMMGGRRGMMGGYVGSNASGEMTITADKARELAQAALDKDTPGVTAATDVQQFYGYYTIDTLRDGKIVGMLSVNGYTGEVWMHTWHGTFIDSTEGGS